MNKSPHAALDDPPDPEKTEPVTPPPPLEPEETPIVVRDHGVETDEAHDIDKAAGDEGIDDDMGDDFDNHDAAGKEEVEDADGLHDDDDGLDEE